MDSAELILNEAISPLTSLGETSKISNASEAKKKQFAKDFESVFINKLFDEMKNTIGSFGSEKDGPSEQIDGIFWLYLARDIADKGGFGMWKDIYKSLTNLEHKNAAAKLLDENV